MLECVACRRPIEPGEPMVIYRVHSTADGARGERSGKAHVVPDHKRASDYHVGV